MSNEYNYDSDAQFFPFFVLTVTSLITLPLTYTLLRAPTDISLLQKAGHIDSDYKPHNEDIITAQRAKQKRKEMRTKRIITAITGWVVMAYMIYLVITTTREAVAIWNPFEILGVPISAAEKAINSRYRKLSITMHPDKRQPNPALNLTLEAINDEWVEITKAYKALTDEEIRNNWEQYGHPDGKQSTSFGIALPKFLVAEGSGKYVLAFYGLLLGIGLPWLVGRWWYGMQKVTREKILVTSAGNMFKEFKDRMDGGEVLAAVSTASEFGEVLHGTKADSGLGKVESKLASTEASDAIMLPKDKTKLKEVEDPVQRKALALLWAYLTRLDLEDATLEAEKYDVAPTAERLNQAFVSMCLAYGFTGPVLASFHLSQSLVQAIPPSPAGNAPLLQLPHFTPSAIREIETAANDKKEHMSIQAFMALPAEQRQALAQAAGITNDRLKVAEDVSRRLPYLKVETAFFKVAGEKYIIPSSLVQLVIKARFIPPGTPASSIPKVNPDELLDIDAAEGDIQAAKKEPEQHHIPLAYAPYFARDRAPKWHVFLADNRQGKIAVPPFNFEHFDKKPFDDAGKPTFNVVTLKMQFGAPPQAGEYKFQMHMICDSYVGFDYKQEIIMNIDDASRAQEVDDDDDISEPDEDTIAGQLAALKGDATAQDTAKKVKKVRKAKPSEEDSDYESGTDDEEGASSGSETDTDTDSEAEDDNPNGKSWW